MIENNIALLEQYEHVLLYGENEGIKEDIKNKIKEKNKDSEIIIFFQEEIMNNKNILSEQINNSSLFNLKRIIFLHEITDKSFTQIKECIENKKENVRIYIFSSILEKKSKIRNHFEKNDKLVVLVLYKPNCLVQFIGQSSSIWMIINSIWTLK